MTFIEPPKPPPLPEHAFELLEVLRSDPDEWFNRKQLARSFGKDRLNPHEIILLQRLVDKGLIETAARKNKTPIGYEWVYKATDPEDDA